MGTQLLDSPMKCSLGECPNGSKLVTKYMDSKRPVVSELRVGFLGAGHLGQALAMLWHRKQQEVAPLWSRRYSDCSNSSYVQEACSYYSVSSIDSVLAAKIVFAAIPSKAIGHLAEDYSGFAHFEGLLLAAGIDLPIDAIQRFVPKAAVARIVPILLPRSNDVPSLVLVPSNNDPRWKDCLGSLEMLGPVYSVDDECVFETIMHLTSPFSVVIRSALKHTIGNFLKSRSVHSKWQPIAESVMLTSLLSATSSPIEGSESGDEEVATPGGITEAGLLEVEKLMSGMLSVLSAMTRRADELRH
ncbi:MAG: hypothetical protein F6J86_10605 [Symploca sp. SIO1B1]|nr:hypothetical protein [Symploca sp. SIO1B1]